MSVPPINLQVLEKGKGRDFFQELAKIPLNLNEKTVGPFLKTTFDLLQRSDIPEVSINKLLIALYKIITSKNQFIAPKAIDILINKKYAEKLPFKIKPTTPNLLNLLYALALHAPTSLTLEVSKQISQNLLLENPEKVLTILAVFSQHFASVENPWPMLDLLFKPHPNVFRSSSVDYVSLLTFLCHEFEDYREARLQHCWNSICETLNNDNVPSLDTSYYSLCTLYDIDPERVKSFTFPTSACSIHLRKPSLIRAVISLLLRFEPSISDEDSYELSPTKNKSSTAWSLQSLVQSLLSAAQTEVDANLILVRMATRKAIARILIHDSTWMTKELPTKTNTIRLFAMILSHSDLLSELMQKVELIDFLRNMCQMNTRAALSACSHFIRRLPLNKEFIEQLSKTEFLTDFFITSTTKKDTPSKNVALVMADTIAKITYVRELLMVCDFVSNLIKQGDELEITAGKVAVHLCLYPKCAHQFKKNKLNDFYSRKLNDPNLKRIAQHFLKTYQRSIQQPLSTPSTPNKNLPNDTEIEEEEEDNLTPPDSPMIMSKHQARE